MPKKTSKPERCCVGVIHAGQAKARLHLPGFFFMGIMKKKQITLSKKIGEMRLNSLSEKVRKLLDSIDHQILIDKAEQWLLSLRKKQRIDLFERYFDKGYSLTELEDYAVFVALAEKVCRDHVNRYLYPLDEPLGTKRIPIDTLASEINDCPDDWITLFEAIICRIAKRHSVELSESIQQDAQDMALSLMTPEAKVLAVYADMPDLNLTAIAKTAGVNRTSLYRMEKFMAVWIMQHAEENTSYRDAKPKGEIDGETGNIEAWKK